MWKWGYRAPTLQRVRHANTFDKHGSQINVGDTNPTWLEWPFCGLLGLQGGFASGQRIQATSDKKGFTNHLSCIREVKVKSIADLFKMQTKE